MGLDMVLEPRIDSFDNIVYDVVLKYRAYHLIVSLSSIIVQVYYISTMRYILEDVSSVSLVVTY